MTPIEPLPFTPEMKDFDEEVETGWFLSVLLKNEGKTVLQHFFFPNEEIVTEALSNLRYAMASREPKNFTPRMTFNFYSRGKMGESKRSEGWTKVNVIVLDHLLAFSIKVAKGADIDWDQCDHFTYVEGSLRG